MVTQVYLKMIIQRHSIVMSDINVLQIKTNVMFFYMHLISIQKHICPGSDHTIDV